MNPSEHTFCAGSRVGNYLILEKLGEGGMAEVFKAIEPALERYVAIKVMLRSQGQTAEQLADFLEEARAIAGLRHTNIVPLYSAGEEGGLPYLAMGYIEGTTLEDWLLTDRIMTIPEAIWFMRQSIAALDYAARSNIIHLDVKPSNFMIGADNVLMLTDFGLARRVSDVTSGVLDHQELQGTPAYASPEHILQRKPDLRTDIYCLGATLFHLISGEFPYPAETTEDACRQHIYAPFPGEVLSQKGIPQGWINVIRKMMEKDPLDRFQTYPELRQAIDNVNHFQYGRKALHAEASRENQALPRTGGSPENLFDMVPDEMAVQGEHLFKLGDPYSSEMVMEMLNTRWPVLCLNAIADDLKAMQSHGSEDIRELLQALVHIPSYKETLDDLSNFMANASDSRPQSDAERIELVGLDRARNLALNAIALYRIWQSEKPLNCHHVWQHMIYTGIMSEFIVDMLGLPKTDLEYLGGTVHDIGKLLFLELFPNKTIAVWMHAFELNVPLYEVEMQYFGMTHCEIGFEWLRRHKFHPQVCFLALYHDQPDMIYLAMKEANSYNILSNLTLKEANITLLGEVVKSANALVKELGLGYGGNPRMDEVPWIERPETLSVFESRTREDVTFEEFQEFFTVICRDLPDIAFMKLTHASEAAARRRASKKDKIRSTGEVARVKDF